ncbi:DUF4412 domain-containing protein [Desulfonatronospira sp.]|uniref:DUF4412 domain-containing protein n=1 Tax=Desulfonatronospira sp. TaxID=1962951 RepID=UPI0025C027F7|nr:DUF4412 domain-containing protein [Desulfonatronospira sp.]
MESKASSSARLWSAILGITVVFLMLFFVPGIAFSGGMITSYSADWVMLSKDGTVVSTSKLYITPEAYRMDGMPMGDGSYGISDNITFLGLYKEKKEYLYNHDKKLYFEDDLDEEMMMGMMNLFKYPDSEVVLGRENVSGYPCVKKRVTTTTDMMGMELTFTYVVWQSERFEMPLRVQDEEGNITEMQNINTSKPAAGLFRPIQGYTRVDNMMAVLGMDFGADLMPEEGDEWLYSRPDKEDPAGERTGWDTRDVDADEMMEVMEKFLILAEGDPEEMAEFSSALSAALGLARGIETDTDDQEGIWQRILLRTGDKIGSEMKVPPDTYLAILGTPSSLDQVCDFYEDQLVPDGWQNSGRHVQDNEGFMLLTRGDEQLTVSSADDPGMAGHFRTFYYLKLTGAASETLASQKASIVASAAETSEREKARQRGDSEATGLLFANSDFEHGDLTNWRASGDAFIYQPTKGDNPTARRRGQPSQHQGEYWIGTFEKYQGDPGQNPGDTQGDGPTGTLTSIPFTIEGDSISFLIGGGNRPDATYVALVVDGREVLKATGNNHESMNRVTWDVIPFRGKEGRILIADKWDRGWGHINADDFRYGDGE